MRPSELFGLAEDGLLILGTDSIFDLKESKAIIIDSLLTRKLRNNGLGTHLRRVLKRSGDCRFSPMPGASVVGRKASLKGAYAFYLRGTATDAVLAKLNRNAWLIHALEESRLTRNERRRLRALGLLKAREREQQKRALAGENGRLKRHFRKSTITWGDAVAVIAKACRLPEYAVRECFIASLDERGVATMRLSSRFVFRIDLTGYKGLVSETGGVTLSSTNDNASPVYRRLRNALRRWLGCVRKDRQAFVEQARVWRRTRRTQQILAAA